jgi:hypothetical protein
LYKKCLRRKSGAFFVETISKNHFTPRHCEARSNPQQADNGYWGFKLTSSRSWLRGASYFFLDKKVTKKSSQQGGFFAAQAFALQNEQNHGLQLFCPATLALFPNSSAKTCYALSYAQGQHRSAHFHPKLTY